MIALRLAFRGVSRRGWGLLLIILPAALLFGMLTFLLASEATVRQLAAPGIAPRAVRLGSVEGMSTWEASSYSQAEINQLANIPGVTPAPAQFIPCYIDPNQREEFNCGYTNRTYIQIWAMDVPVSEADLDRWDAVKNGAIVTRAAAAKHRWHVGDHINLYHHRDEPTKQNEVEFVITSIADKYIDSTTIYVHNTYYEKRFNKVMRFWVVWFLVDSPEHRPAVMEQIDAKMTEFHRPHLLWTMETTKQAILAGSAVLRESFRVAGGFSLLLVVCIAFALLILSIEQRNTEFAVLLAIGFRRGVLARSILAEGILLLLPAAFLGAVCIWLPFHDNPIMFEVIFRVKVTLQDAAAAIVGGALIGLLAAVVPAWRVFRLDVLSSLR